MFLGSMLLVVHRIASKLFCRDVHELHPNFVEGETESIPLAVARVVASKLRCCVVINVMIAHCRDVNRKEQMYIVSYKIMYSFYLKYIWSFF